MKEIEAPRPLLSWRPVTVLAILGVWTGLVIMVAAGGVLAFRRAERPLDFAPYVRALALNWYTCAVFTPLFAWMARRWPIERRTWKWSVPLWLAVTSLAVPAKFVLEFVGLQFIQTIRAPRPLGEMIASGYVAETIAFWAMIGVILSIEYYDRWRVREVQANALGRELAEARLEVLSSQLQPHFLFNALQSISTLLHRDVKAADRMLTNLANLLRESLRHSGAAEVSLADELTTLEHYLAIQRIRFQDRLTISVDVTDGHDVNVPRFVLQPLVENAIEHGVARRAGAGHIGISSRLAENSLVLEISDNGGSAREPRSRNGSGIGLANTRARLATLYGEAAQLDAAPDDDGAFRVRVVIPRHASRAATS